MNMNSGIVLAQADGRPLYLQIMDHIQKKIAVGDWMPGQQIPSIRALAVELSISVITVKRAYLELERQGTIVTQQGRGCFVNENPDLGTELLQKDLLEHLQKAVGLAKTLGLEQKTLLKQVSEKWEEDREPST